MKTRSHRARSAGNYDIAGMGPNPEAMGVSGSNTTEKGMGSAIKRRIGSIRRRKHDPEV